MNKLLTVLIFILISSFYYLVSPVAVPQVYADELAEIEKQLEELTVALEMSRQATAPLESNLVRLEEQLENLQLRINTLAKQLAAKEEQLKAKEESLTEQQLLLERRIREFYKTNKRFNATPLKYLMDSKDLRETIRLVFYNRAVLTQDRDEIVQLVLYIKNLEEKKIQLQSEQERLAVIREETDKQAAFLKEEVKGAKEYQAELETKIAELTARQKQLLAEKTQLFSTSVGEVPLSADPAARPDYNPGFSPAFAAFSFGAPHFKGMSQYGAFGRAKEGQSMEDILRAYYGDVRIESVDTNFDLPTVVGTLPFEDNYLKGIAEMPTKWADEGGYEALKAQAIAARSYALAYTGWRMGNRTTKSAICITEQCQVYNSGKASNPGRWGDAVNDTRGKILVSNNSNEVVNSWYASTSGGYQESYSSLGHTTPGFWDTKSGRDGWTSEAYEKIAGSPWFYKGWYKTQSGKDCGRNHPWLNKDEFADIVNAVLVYSSGGDTSGIYPLDVQSCFGGSDTPWSSSRLAEEADKHGGRVTSVSDLSVLYASNGVTAQVEIRTNRGTLTFDGQAFYRGFNLRAPGAIHLKSGLFNIERK